MKRMLGRPLRDAGKRGLVALSFAMLLVGLSAGQVLASTATAGSSEPTASAEPMPPLDPGEGTLREEEKEAEEQERRETPQAIQEREESKTAFAQISSAEASELLTSEFGQQLQELNDDPARLLSLVEIEKPLGTFGAEIADGEGGTELLESPVPIQSPVPGEGLQPVDLSLEEAGSGFVTHNALTEVELPEESMGTIQLPRGVEISDASGGSPSKGVPLGEMNVFYPDSQPSTDTLISPISGGVEVFEQLRSEESPEQFRYTLSVPAGGRVRPGEEGGAEVLDGTGEVVATVPAPSAVDAQGVEVPVTMTVEGSSLLLEVPHRSREIAYPILLDPEFTESYPSIGNAAWPFSPGPGYEGAYSCIVSTACWGSTGLYTRSRGENFFYGANTYGQFVYTLPNSTAFIRRAVFSPINGSVHSCVEGQYQPHGWVGIYNSSSGSWTSLGVYSPVSVGNASYDTTAIGGVGTNKAVVGIGTAGASSQLPCGHEFEVGGVTMYEDDPEYPTLNPPSGIPTGWTRKDGQNRSISVSASDPGFGVRTVKMFGAGTSQPAWNLPACSALAGSRCPAEGSGTITYQTSMFPLEGSVAMSVQAEDGTGKKTTREYTLELDGLAPTINLQGEFAELTKETGTTEQPQGTADELNLPVYNLKIAAEDGTAAAPRSGVREVKVYLEGKLLESKAASCSASSCPQELEWTYPVTLTGLSEGKHTLEISATDFVGNEVKPSERKIEFEYIPATGMKEEYVLQHFVLPDGHNYEGEPDYEGPEVAVNVTNGNVVFRQRDVRVHGHNGYPLELERIYNSQQPTARDGQWGHGWSVAQTPEFKPEGESAPKTARMVRTSAITSAVQLPETQTQTSFSSRLHATIGKTSSGGYEVRSATDEETSLFSSSGRIEETRLSSVSPEATVQPEPVFPAFAEAFGSAGAGTGQFSHPADATVDSKGNVWVVDKAGNRVEEFNEAGEFVRAAGTLGSGAGQLNAPSGVAMDSFGNVDVTDTANNRIVRFNEKGEFVSAVGANVNKTKVESGGTLAEKNHCTGASGNVCQAGTAGSAEGLMSEPIGITTTGGGNFLVVEKANSRVEKFNTNGELLAKFGSLGSEAGKLKEPTAIASSPAGSGYFWVADTGNNRIEEWTSSFAFVRAVGKEGAGNGEFKAPAAIEADSEGNVYVGDVGNNRVQELSKSGDYITQFGGEGQLSLSAPMGILLDSSGDLWVTDSERNQVQEWLTGAFVLQGCRIGSFGTGNGQFNHPADVATDRKGNLWVLDRGNSRIEEFNEKGEFLTAVGSQGTAAGKLSSPAGLAVDPSGNLWIADTGNNRIEEFNEKGEFVLTFGREVNKTKVESGGTSAEKFACTAASGNVCQAGVAGSSEGWMNAPQGIAATSGGNLWIADTGNNRLKKFSPSGGLINVISSEGSEAGKVKEPGAIAMGPDGTIWVADTGNNRVEQWSTTLTFLREFGSEGTGNGKFKRPAALDVDSSGNVWVGDQNNQRLQEFTGTGEYVAQLGSPAQFAFSGPMGLTTDGKGNVWVTDTDHNRVQKFPATQFAEPVAAQVPAIGYSYSSGALTKMELQEPGSSTDPALNLSLASGLTASVASEAAGTTTYSYEAGNLASEKNAEGETKFTRNASNRLTKIELPNGTWARIEYDSIGRATEVTVKPAGGSEKTTHFWYGTEPRETRVWGGDKPEVIYSISKEGSVFKWEYAETPPTIEEPSGSLWANRGKEVENKDQTLFVHASSPHEIASIKVLENGNAVIAEETCKDPSEPPEHNCDHVELSWVTNPSEHAPGRLNLELVATDFLGHSSVQSFSVVIPQQPEPSLEAPEPPTFASTKAFREEHGLDRNHPLSHSEMTNLVLELIYEWDAQKPTALAAAEAWGVPMRSAELSEMEYRREYVDQASEFIPEWAEEHAANAYGGFYVDERAGGNIYVGFTENQASLVEALKATGVLMNPSVVQAFPVPPKSPLVNVEQLAEEVSDSLYEAPTQAEITSSVYPSTEESTVIVGSSNPNQTQQYVLEHFGSGANIRVLQEGPGHLAVTRYEQAGPEFGGSALKGNVRGACTAGFAARRKVGENNGTPEYLYYTLTAGHCYPNLEKVFRLDRRSAATAPSPSGVPLGFVKGNAWFNQSAPITDVAAISIDPNKRSHKVVNYSLDSQSLEAQSIQGTERPRINQYVCWSGFVGGSYCGKVLFKLPSHDERSKKHWVFRVDGWAAQGDSGSPVWDPKTHKAVGLISSIRGLCKTLPFGSVQCSEMEFTPFLPKIHESVPAGIDATLGIEVLKEQ